MARLYNKLRRRPKKKNKRQNFKTCKCKVSAVLMLLQTWDASLHMFLSSVSMPVYADRDIVLPILFVCPSVGLSVQCQYCV